MHKLEESQYEIDVFEALLERSSPNVAWGLTLGGEGTRNNPLHIAHVSIMIDDIRVVLDYHWLISANFNSVWLLTLTNHLVVVNSIWINRTWRRIVHNMHCFMAWTRILCRGKEGTRTLGGRGQHTNYKIVWKATWNRENCDRGDAF